MLARQTVNVGNDDVENIVLAPPGVATLLKGSVRVAGDNPPKPGGLRVNLMSLEDPYAGGSAAAKDDGSFALPDLPPNRYAFTIFSLPEGTYLKSFKLGDQELPGSILDLTQASGEIPFEITLGSTPAEVSGSVQNDQQLPAQAVSVIMFPDPFSADTSFPQTGAQSDRQGQFSVRKLAPGNYKIYAFEDFDYQRDLDPEILKKLESKAVKLKLDENGKGQVQLQLITAAASEEARRP